jgi:hypothetical protein
VDVWDHDPVDLDDPSGKDDYIGNAWTDGRGYWSLTFNNDRDGWPNNRRADCYIKLYALNGDIAAIRHPLSGSSEWAQSQWVGNVPDGLYSFGTVTVPWGKEGEAFMIFDSIVTAWLFIRDQTGVSVPMAEISYPCEDSVVACPGRPYFDPFVTRNIYLQRGESRDTHVHEYGHWVMYQAYGGTWPVPSDVQLSNLSWDLGRYMNAYIGWSEGWATFLAMAVFGRNTFDDQNLESIETSRNWAETAATPGRVAAALWDALDPLNPRVADGCDTGQVSFRSLFETLWYAPIQERFHHFYEQFKARYPAQAHILHAAAMANTINYDTGALAPTLTAPAAGEWLSGTVPLSATANDPDTIGGDSITFEYSTDGSTWQPILPATPIASGTQMLWDVSSINSASVQVRAKATDESSSCSGMEGISAPSAIFGIDNSAPAGPRILSSSHSGTPAWSNDRTIEVRWAPAADNGPAQSGVIGYQTYFHYVASRTDLPPSPCDPGVPSVFTANTSITSPTLRTGVYTFYVSALDAAGNCSGRSSIGSFQIDINAPSTVELIRPAKQARTTIQPILEWTSSSDGRTTGWPPVAGVGFYRVQMTQKLDCGLLACFPDWSAARVLRVEPSASPTVTFVPESLSSGRWYWRVQAFDNAGNASGLVESEFEVDAPPTIIVPSLVEAEATGPNGAVVSYEVRVSDDIDRGLAAVCVPPSGETFPLGDTLVKCTARDSFGNVVDGSFIVRVRDTTAPIITLAGQSTVTLLPGQIYIETGATAVDIVDGNLSSMVTVDGTVDTSKPGTYLLTYRATDRAGNSAAVERTVGVIEEAQPPNSIIIARNGPNGLILTWEGEPTMRLQKLTRVNGPFIDVPATEGQSKYEVTAEGSMGYFRLVKP